MAGLEPYPRWPALGVPAGFPAGVPAGVPVGVLGLGRGPSAVGLVWGLWVRWVGEPFPVVAEAVGEAPAEVAELRPRSSTRPPTSWHPSPSSKGWQNAQ